MGTTRESSSHFKVPRAPRLSGGARRCAGAAPTSRADKPPTGQGTNRRGHRVAKAAIATARAPHCDACFAAARDAVSHPRQARKSASRAVVAPVSPARLHQRRRHAFLQQSPTAPRNSRGAPGFEVGAVNEVCSARATEKPACFLLQGEARRRVFEGMRDADFPSPLSLPTQDGARHLESDG